MAGVAARSAAGAAVLAVVGPVERGRGGPAECLGGGRRGAAGCRPGRQGPGAAAPAAIVDSQSAKSSEGGQGRSFDAHGRVTGCTRHALVDVEGNLLLVGVTGAGTADTAAAPELLTQPRRTCPNLRVVWCDPGYQAGFVEAAGGLGLEAAVVGRQPGTRGVAVLPRRWVVERFFAWLSRARRLARDFARAVWSACGMVPVGYARMLLRRLTWARAVA